MRLMLSGVDVLRIPPGPSATPTQIIPIWAANKVNCSKVDSLSPLGDAELVKPAANLSFQDCPTHLSKAFSRNALKTAEALPM